MAWFVNWILKKAMIIEVGSLYTRLWMEWALENGG